MCAYILYKYIEDTWEHDGKDKQLIEDDKEEDTVTHLYTLFCDMPSHW